MPVENIECQIAKGQMSRYLAGDSLSPEMAVELRAHIAECPGCADTLHKKREILQAMLSGSGGRIAVEAPASRETPEPSQIAAVEPPQPMNRISAMLLDRLVKAPQSAQAVARLEERPKPSQFWKPLIYSGALALAMLGMSFVMRDPTKLFGSRLADETADTGSTRSASSPSPVVKPTPAPATSPKTESTSPNEAKKALAPGKEASRAPKTGTPQQSSGSQPEAKPDRSSTSSRRPAKSRPTSARKKTQGGPAPTGIRLYDPDGNPIR